MLARFFLTLTLALFSLCPAPAQSVTDARIRFYLDKIAQDPQHYTAYAILGGAYLQKARETGDASFYDRADDALQRSLSIQPNYEAIRLMSTLCLARHRFAEALAYARKAVETSPADRQAYAALFDAYFEMGYYTEAEATLKTMTEAVEDFASWARLSRLRFLKGDTQTAVVAMERALQTVQTGQPSTENAAWCQVQLGDYFFNLGNLSRSERYYLDALKTLASYPPAQEHLAKLHIARKKYAAAVNLYRQAMARSANPDLYAALGEVYALMGRAALAQEQFALAEEKMNEAVQKGEQGYYRHLALFYLSRDRRLDRALELSKKDLTLRHDVYTYDTLAWASYKNGLFREARQAIDEALKPGTKDARLFFHAGMIYYALKDVSRAREYLSSALSVNPYFDVQDVALAKKRLKHK